jgi:hypothetical protein
MTMNWKNFASLLIMVLALAALVTSGCSVIDTAYDISEIFSEGPPVPVCDSDSAGVNYDGRVCVKFCDDAYRWVDEKN